MVNTVVTFGNNQSSSVATMPVVIDADIDSSSRGRRLYLIVGLFLVMIILFPTIVSMKQDRQDFAYHLLLIVHCSEWWRNRKNLPSDCCFLGFLCLFFLFTFLYRSNSIDLWNSADWRKDSIDRCWWWADHYCESSPFGHLQNDSLLHPIPVLSSAIPTGLFAFDSKKPFSVVHTFSRLFDFSFNSWSFSFWWSSTFSGLVC